MQFQSSELHVSTYTEQAGGSLDQGVVGGEGDITRLDEFDNLILLTLITQFDVLGVEVEGGIGVVVQVHVHLVAHLTRHVQVNLLVEIDRLRLSVTLRQ